MYACSATQQKPHAASLQYHANVLRNHSDKRLKLMCCLMNQLMLAVQYIASHNICRQLRIPGGRKPILCVLIHSYRIECMYLHCMNEQFPG